MASNYTTVLYTGSHSKLSA